MSNGMINILSLRNNGDKETTLDHMKSNNDDRSTRAQSNHVYTVLANKQTRTRTRWPRKMDHNNLVNTRTWHPSQESKINLQSTEICLVWAKDQQNLNSCKKIYNTSRILRTYNSMNTRTWIKTNKQEEHRPAEDSNGQMENMAEWQAQLKRGSKNESKEGEV